MFLRRHRLEKGERESEAAGLGGGRSILPRGLRRSFRYTHQSRLWFEGAARLRRPASGRIPKCLRNPLLPSIAQNAGAKAALSRHPPLHSNADRLRIPSSPRLALFPLLRLAAFARRRPDRMVVR